MYGTCAAKKVLTYLAASQSPLLTNRIKRRETGRHSLTLLFETRASVFCPVQQQSGGLSGSLAHRVAGTALRESRAWRGCRAESLRADRQVVALTSPAASPSPTRLCAALRGPARPRATRAGIRAVWAALHPPRPTTATRCSLTCTPPSPATMGAHCPARGASACPRTRRTGARERARKAGRRPEHEGGEGGWDERVLLTRRDSMW